MIYWTLFWSFIKIGLFAFGGGYTIVALAQSEFVKNKKWISDKELFETLMMSQTLPGVISVNFAAFIGNKKAGFLGGICAVLGLIIPAIVFVLSISHIISHAENHPMLIHALNGVRIAVIVLILSMIINQAKISARSRLGQLLAVTAFTGITWGFSPVIFLIGSAIIGWIYYKTVKKVFL